MVLPVLSHEMSHAILRKTLKDFSLIAVEIMSSRSYCRSQGACSEHISSCPEAEVLSDNVQRDRFKTVEVF